MNIANSTRKLTIALIVYAIESINALSVRFDLASLIKRMRRKARSADMTPEPAVDNMSSARLARTMIRSNMLKASDVKSFHVSPNSLRALSATKTPVNT